MTTATCARVWVSSRVDSGQGVAGPGSWAAVDDPVENPS
jgi:hypothetical protein